MKTLRTFGVGVGVMLMLMAAWSALLSHNLTRVERLTDAVKEQSRRNLLMLSADSLEYRDYYAQFPTTFKAMNQGNSIVEFVKRPLYGPVSATLTIMLALVGLVYPANLYVILSFYAALSVVLAWRLFKSTGLSWAASGLLAATCGVSFSWLSLFGIPESYSLTVVGALVVMLSGTRLVDRDMEAPGAQWTWMSHAVAAGIGGWLYLPIVGAVLLLLPALRSRRALVTVLLPAAAIAVAVAVAPQFLFGVQGVNDQIAYGGRWVSLGNFARVSRLAEVAAAFLWFGFAAPVPDFLYSSAELSLDVLRPGSKTMLIALVMTAATTCLWRWSSPHALVRRVSGSGAWLASLYIFHVYFNPNEVLLYMAVPVAVAGYTTALAMTAGHGTRAEVGITPTHLGVLAAMVLLLAVVNYGAVYGA